MRITAIIAGAVAALAFGMPAMAQTAGDPAAGEKVFNKCRACHAVGPGATNKVGPELNGVFNEAPAAADYAFSPALKAFGAANPKWTDELATAWLTEPKKLVPGTKMAFPGLKKPEEIANVIAYLKTFGEKGEKTN